MRRIALALTFTLLTLGWFTVASPAPAEDLEILLAELQVTPLPAAAAPQFKLETLDGKPLALADLRGHPVLLYFWATW